MTKKYIYFVCPYISQSFSASATYTYNIIDYISSLKEYNIHIISPRRFIERDNITYHEPKRLKGKQIKKLLGPRIYPLAYILKFVMSNNTNILITDLNPCVTFLNRDNIYHIIHHLNDIPFLDLAIQNLRLDNYFFKVINKQIARVCWKLMLIMSPRNIITVSNYVKDHIKIINKHKKVHVIRNFNRYEEYMKKIYSNQAGQRTYDFIAIGNNIVRKNYKLLSDSINILSTLVPGEIKITLVGQDVKDLTASFDPRVKVYTYSNITSSELADLICQSKIFVNCSTIEGFCIPYIEAQSFGLVSIVPDTNLFKENKFTNNVYFCSLEKKSYVAALQDAYRHAPSDTLQKIKNIDKIRYYGFSKKMINQSILQLLITNT